MNRSTAADRRSATPGHGEYHESGRRLLADGGRESDEENEESGDDAGDDAAGVGASDVEITEEGEADPVEPKWEEPDIDDIPEVDGPKTRPAESDGATGSAGGESEATSGGRATDHAGVGGTRSDDPVRAGASGGESDDPTAGMPNTAQSPGQSRLREGGAEGYVVALELCARLPDEMRLPDEAADLVPVALEAELEQDIQSFAADEFDNPAPHVETLDFVEVDDELWLRLRLGVDPDSFAALDPDEIEAHALQQLDGLL